VRIALIAILFCFAGTSSPASAAQWKAYDARGRVTTASDSCKGQKFAACVDCCHQFKAEDGQRKWSNRQCAGYCSSQPK
jgi:hypothetical protein